MTEDSSSPLPFTRLVFDFGFNAMMTAGEARALGRQLALSFAANRRAARPFNEIVMVGITRDAIAARGGVDDQAERDGARRAEEEGPKEAGGCPSPTVAGPGTCVRARRPRGRRRYQCTDGGSGVDGGDGAAAAGPPAETSAEGALVGYLIGQNAAEWSGVRWLMREEAHAERLLAPIAPEDDGDDDEDLTEVRFAAPPVAAVERDGDKGEGDGDGDGDGGGPPAVVAGHVIYLTADSPHTLDDDDNDGGDYDTRATRTRAEAPVPAEPSDLPARGAAAPSSATSSTSSASATAAPSSAAFSFTTTTSAPPPTTFVIGALVDHTDKPGASLARARRMRHAGVRTARLPLERFVRFRSRQPGVSGGGPVDISTLAVVQLLLLRRESRAWGAAVARCPALRCAPIRKCAPRPLAARRRSLHPPCRRTVWPPPHARGAAAPWCDRVPCGSPCARR